VALEPDRATYQDDPARICGNIWAHGTDAQRAGFGSGPEGRKPGEHPPKAWWDDCAAKVAKNAAAYACGPKPAQGGRYAATEAEDGTWTIHDVPVVVAHVPDERVRTATGIERVDGTWLRKALVKMQARRGEGYEAPAHLRHFGETGRAKIGYFVPTRIGPITYEGRTVEAMFADLAGLDRATFDAIDTGKFPYASVEILFPQFKDPEVASVSITDEVPRFRLPLITIGRKRKREQVPEAVAYEATDDRAEVAVCVFAAASEDDSMDEPAKKPEEGGASSAVDALIGKIESAKFTLEDLGKLKACLEKCLEKLGGGAAQAAGPSPVEMAQAAKPAPAVTVERYAADLGERDAKIAALHTTISGLQTKLQAQEAERARGTAIDAAVKRMKGYAVVGDPVKIATEWYDAYGAKALDAHVGALVASAVREPDHAWAASDAGEADGLPKDVAEYQAKGPGIVERALFFARQYDAIELWAKKNDGPDARKNYIARQMAAEQRS
jgi:hypothetical protein